jgi:hypothetical protein
LAYAKPVWYFEVPESERDARVWLTDDLCTIRPSEADAEGAIIHAIRAMLEIPIVGVDEPVLLGVWVTQSEASFARYVETFGLDQSGCSSFGWLPVTIPGFARTGDGEALENLGCDVRWGPPGRRPTLAIQESPHPLFAAQRDGISWERAVRLAEAFLHG